MDNCHRVLKDSCSHDEIVLISQGVNEGTAGHRLILPLHLGMELGSLQAGTYLLYQHTVSHMLYKVQEDAWS